jgi:hypothetical protein
VHSFAQGSARRCAQSVSFCNTDSSGSGASETDQLCVDSHHRGSNIPTGTGQKKRGWLQVSSCPPCSGGRAPAGPGSPARGRGSRPGVARGQRANCQTPSWMERRDATSRCSTAGFPAPSRWRWAGIRYVVADGPSVRCGVADGGRACERARIHRAINSAQSGTRTRSQGEASFCRHGAERSSRLFPESRRTGRRAFTYSAALAHSGHPGSTTWGE